MPKNIDVTIRDGRAQVSAESRQDRRAALRALLAVDRTGVEAKTDGPRRYWEVPESVARKAGLVDSGKPKASRKAAKSPAGESGESVAGDTSGGSSESAESSTGGASA